MRYNSPVAQLTLIAVVVLLTTGVRRILDFYLMQWTPINENLGFSRFLPAGITACITGIVGVFFVNLIAFRYVFIFYALTNVFYAASVISFYYQGFQKFQYASLIIGIVGYYPSRMATLVIVLAYPGEKWKARALAVFLLIEYLSNAIGDIIAIENLRHSGGSQRLVYSIVYLCIACIAPFLAIGIAPSQEIVRSNGVYLISPETNIRTELREMKNLLVNKNMLYLLPYMFFYPMYFSVANIELPDTLLIAMYDIGKILILLMGQLLDVPWATRKTRGCVGLAVVAFFFVISFSLVTVVRTRFFSIDGYDHSWSTGQITKFLINTIIEQQYKLLLSVLFFGGVISGLAEMYGYWVMGTLTNDLKSSARFVGTYHSFMALGGLTGFELAKKNGLPSPAHGGYYVAAAGSFFSFVLVYFVVRQITETNDWSLGSIAGEEILYMTEGVNNNNNGRIEDGVAGSAANAAAFVPDVKHHHTRPSTTRDGSLSSF
ncbi:hypothetical protein IWW45_008877 [Coemansia sp. RSA 485]|nr:hypothetical protein IWW45_008877 [Coemansia sp. RSA 485]